MKWEIEGASISYPSCPSCLKETDHNGDDFYCDACGLGWLSSDPERPGFRLDDELPVCGVEKPVRDKSEEVIGGVLHRFMSSPCLLSEGHTYKWHYHHERWVPVSELKATR
jgi:hypothetical protein